MNKHVKKVAAASLAKKYLFMQSNEGTKSSRETIQGRIGEREGKDRK